VDEVGNQLEDSMQIAFDKFEDFEDVLRSRKPENWERDVLLIEKLKRTVYEIYQQFKKKVS